MKRTYFKNIELLRFIFVLVIMYCHLWLITSSFKDVSALDYITNHLNFSAYAVDFFFILSGFFLAYTLNINLSLIEFMTKRAKRLWGVVAFSIVGYLCLNFFHISSYGRNVYDYIYGLFFLDNIGITIQHIGPSWYVSVLFFVSLFYFYLYKALPERTANLIVGFLVWFAYVYLININNGYISDHILTTNNVFCSGLLRGIGGIGLGIFIFKFYDEIGKNIHTDHIFIFTILEILVMGWCLSALCLAPHDIHNSMIFILAFVALIILFLLKQGYLTKILDNHVSVCLGKYAYSIFLTHLLVFYCVKGSIIYHQYAFIVQHPILYLVFVYVICILLGVATYHFIEKPDNKLFRKIGFVSYYGSIFAFLIVISFLSSVIFKTNLYQYRGGELSTNISRQSFNDGSVEVNNTSSGFLTYGPYVDLKKGKYHCIVKYESVNAEDSYFEVTADAGKNVIVRQYFAEHQKQISFDFYNASSLSQVEFRTVYAGKGRLKIKNIKFEKQK